MVEIEIQTPENYETVTLLKAFIANGMNKPFRFYCPTDSSVALMQRIRVKLSRERKKAEAAGKKRKHFRLMSDIVTSDVTLMDLITVTLEQRVGDYIKEAAEDYSPDTGV